MQEVHILYTMHIPICMILGEILKTNQFFISVPSLCKTCLPCGCVHTKTDAQTKEQTSAPLVLKVTPVKYFNKSQSFFWIVSSLRNTLEMFYRNIILIKSVVKLIIYHDGNHGVSHIHIEC